MRTVLGRDMPAGGTHPLTRWWVTLAVSVACASAICPSKCACDDEALVVTCEGTNLGVVPITLNPGVRQLFLRYNAIRAIFTSLTFYKDLELLDLSLNRLASLESRCFEEQARLRELHLSRNQIETVANGTFFGLGALRVLRLDTNLLKKLSGATFAHLRSLEELDVSANRLAAISEDAFRGLGRLRTLRLADNRLTRVPPGLGALRSLAQLQLDSNPLLGIDSAAFIALPSLVELSIDGCHLRDVATGALQGLGALEVLRVRDNALTHVPAPAEWAHVPRLEELALGGNAFDELPAGAFAELRALRTLEIDASPRLRVVRARAFVANPALHSLSLSRNSHLGHVEARAFEGLANLRHLALRENALHTVSEELVLPLVSLETLDVRDNPLDCNCSLLWLHGWLRARNASALAHVQCQSPAALQQRFLSDIGADDLGCFSASTQQQVIFGVVTAATIACLSVLIFFVYKYRRRVTRVLKDQWTEGALRSKDVHYEKTIDDEESTILHVAQQSLKMTPVTEL